MPASEYAYGRLVTVPFSEAAIASRLAGQTCLALEEDIYVNGNTIPMDERRGCYVLSRSNQRVPLLKSEAGWNDPHPVVRPSSDLTLLRQVLNHADKMANGEAVDAYNLLAPAVRSFLNGS